MRDMVPCPDCNGLGDRVVYHRTVTCARCRGRGRVPAFPCEALDGPPSLDRAALLEEIAEAARAHLAALDRLALAPRSPTPRREREDVLACARRLERLLADLDR